MREDASKILLSFYNSSWDLSVGLLVANDAVQIAVKNSGLQGFLDHNKTVFSIHAVTTEFRTKANQFMTLTGDDIPREHWVTFDTVDEVLQADILKKMEFLEGEWSTLCEVISNASIPDKVKWEESARAMKSMQFASNGIMHDTDMYVIANLHGMLEEMTPSVK